MLKTEALRTSELAAGPPGSHGSAGVVTARHDRNLATRSSAHASFGSASSAMWVRMGAVHTGIFMNSYASHVGYV